MSIGQWILEQRQVDVAVDLHAATLVAAMVIAVGLIAVCHLVLHVVVLGQTSAVIPLMDVQIVPVTLIHPVIFRDLMLVVLAVREEKGMTLNLLVDIFVVWRLTHLIQSEDGPYDIFFKFKRWVQEHSRFWFELVKCFYCLSVWWGLAMSLYRIRTISGEVIWYGLGLSGAAILLQLITGDKD